MSVAAQSHEDIGCTRKIENYKSCQTWFEGYNSPSTKMAYNTHLSLFCKHHNTNPDFLAELKSEQIKPMVIDYIIHLKK
jgi:hypothetical protein